MNAWFISDLHLKDVHERNGNTLLRFLFFLNRNPKEHQLFLLGDIFDVWVSDGSFFLKHFKQIVDQLTEFKKGGGQLYYFEGNHDVHIDRFWTRKLGVPVIAHAEYFHIQGLRVRVEHGDLMNPDDTAYLKYRRWVYHPAVEFFAHTLPSHLWQLVATWQSGKSRKKTSRYAIENAERIKKIVHTHAEKTFRERPFDLIVSGHMHIFDDYKTEEYRSINLGTWLEKPVALKITSGQIEIINIEQLF